jgi:hypothetical protein
VNRLRALVQGWADDEVALMRRRAMIQAEERGIPG